MVKAIPAGAEIEKGQTVITSGLGGIFPEGLLVGKVVEVKPDQYGLNLTALVKPGADFYDIKNVMVTKKIMREADVTDLTDGKEEGS
jgi:rod shape-determining protein MreC